MTFTSKIANGRVRTLRQRGVALVPNVTRETAGGAVRAQVPLARQSLRNVTSTTHGLSQNRTN